MLSSSNSPQGASETRILLVDDNVDALEVMATLLRMYDHEVATATTPRAALDMVKDFRPSLAILDIGLPGMDGYQLAAELRRTLGEEVPLRLIALTGYARDVDAERSANAGFERHLVKPLDFDELLRLI